MQIISHVCIQPSTAAGNAALLASAAAAPLLLRAGHAAIDQYLLPAGPTAANPPHAAAAVNSGDGQTVRRTPYRYIDPDADYASIVKNIATCVFR